MTAGDVRAEGRSQSGTVTVTASARAGHGGNGNAGASAGNGGDAIVVDAVSGRTAGHLVLSQLAEGGSGGLSDGGLSGRGGNAFSSLTYRDENALFLEAESVARAGNAGSANVKDMTANGGDALALISIESTRTGAFLNAHAEAWGGGMSSVAPANGGRGHASSYALGAGWAQSSALAYGGRSSGGTDGAAYAESFAISTQKDGFASARADASSGSSADALAISEVRAGGRAASEAQGDGTSGMTVAQSRASGTSGRSVSASAQASVYNQANSLSIADDHVQELYRVYYISANYAEANSLAAGTIDTEMVVESLLAGSVVRAALEEAPSSTIVGHGAMSAIYGRYTQGMQSYTASAMFEFNLDTPAEVTLGLMDFDGRNTGELFSLQFLVTSFGGTILEQSFSDLGAAEAWFSDQTISLGEYSGPAQFSLQFTLSGAVEQGVGFRYVLAAAPVPEPAPAALMLGGLGILGLLNRRRRAHGERP